MKLTTKLVFMLLMIVSVFISCDLETTQYTVTFDSNDGSSIENQIISKNGKIQKPNDPTYSGNVFMGWYEDTDFEFRYNFNDRVDEDMTLYAKWVDGIAVSFDTGEGSNVATVTLLNANRLTRPQDPTLQGFTFSGWYKDTDFRFLYNFDDRVDEDMTLYAKWIEASAGFIFKPTLTGNGYYAEAYVGNATTLTMQSTYNGKPILELGPYLFYNNATLLSVNLPSQLKTI
ncbi:MAG: hypothetical protein EOM67_07690, partial [Spirochaetia bacterium]|nr:hypothetical protein [Spirochaetia bacterium]